MILHQCSVQIAFTLICGIFLIKFTNGKNYGEDKIILIQGHPFLNDDLDELDRTNFYGVDKKIEENDLEIYPGTKWCGRGNLARDYNELGQYKKTDMCCRDHYHCDNIPAGKEKYGIRNDYKSTRSHCKCDKDFFNCLHNVNDNVSNTVGNEYFSFAKSCFQNDYPIVDCSESKTLIFEHRCSKYTFDSSKSKLYQWFDLPYYNSHELPDVNTTDYDKFYTDFNSHLGRF